jgi:PAS domain S-box-containing protein
MDKTVEEEIVLNEKRYIVSKTDTKGDIIYANDYFIEISGYSNEELIRKPHNIIRHPDMPRILFKLMWQRIQTGQNIMALVKNRAKDGRYYWVITDFEAKKDKLTNEIVSYTAFRKAAPKDAINKIIPIYEKLLELEKLGGMKASEKYLQWYLEENNISYDDFINKLVNNKGLFKLFFTAMKKLFG